MKIKEICSSFGMPFVAWFLTLFACWPLLERTVNFSSIIALVPACAFGFSIYMANKISKRNDFTSKREEIIYRCREIKNTIHTNAQMKVVLSQNASINLNSVDSDQKTTIVCSQRIIFSHKWEVIESVKYDVLEMLIKCAVVSSFLPTKKLYCEQKEKFDLLFKSTEDSEFSKSLKEDMEKHYKQIEDEEGLCGLLKSLKCNELALSVQEELKNFCKQAGEGEGQK